MASEDMDTPSFEPPKFLGYYRVAERVRASGDVEVYRARDERLQRDVALKFLPVGWIQDELVRVRLQKETLVLTRLVHPSIEATFEAGSTEGGVDYVVTEYVTGESLEEVIRQGPLAGNEVVRLGAQIAEALAAAHDMGFVHGEIRPDNVRVRPGGRPKIVDFGLARLVGAVRADIPWPMLQKVTWFNMAPEQICGEFPLDLGTDIWGMGVVLYAMATGCPPFVGPYPQVFSEILKGEPLAPSAVKPDVSRALDSIILRCLERKREHRYPSARELAEHLRALAR